VTYAIGVLLPQQKRAEFIALLERALAVDVERQPRLRLENALAQQYARYLLDRVDDLFLDGGST
jgi:predicted anti-sigma-YlaC factor YlaD